MAFFNKVKNFFGVSTVSVEIDCPDTFSKHQTLIEGRIKITGKSDQEVTLVKIELTEHWQTGGSEDKTEKHFLLGKQEVCLEPFTISENEEKVFDFSLPFALIKSENDRHKDQGGVMGGLGKLGALLDQESSTFKLVAMADVKAATFDPNCLKELKMVD